MKMKIPLPALILSLLFQGCMYSSNQLNRLRLGMSRAQVVATMGREPDATGAQADVEYMTYDLFVDFGTIDTGQMNAVRVGMTKDELVGLLGRPDSTSAEPGAEFLTYFFFNPGLGSRLLPFVVRLSGGRVESFGRIYQLADLYDRPVTGALPGEPGFPSALPPAEPSGVPPAVPWEALKEYPYMVRLVDGRVESFGRFLQLMDVVERPVTNALPGEPGFPTPAPVLIVRPAPSRPTAPGLAENLEILADLHRRGILTEKQFEAAKARALAP